MRHGKRLEPCRQCNGRSTTCPYCGGERPEPPADEHDEPEWVPDLDRDAGAYLDAVAKAKGYL